MLHTLDGILVGALVMVLLGFLVGPMIRIVENQTKLPEFKKLPKEVCDIVMARGKCGPILGAVEQLIFFIAFWTQGWPLLASWLAFKVASKWQSWSHVAQFPAPPSPEDTTASEEYVILRHKWVSRRYVTFLLGTGANIVLAALGTKIGRLVLMFG